LALYQAPGSLFLTMNTNGTLAGARRNWAISPEYDVAGALSFGVGTSEGATPTSPRLIIKNQGAVILSGGSTSADGTGITFPATQNASSDANTLDDYEEGTWTPTFTAASGTIAGVSSSGMYTKVGRTVTIIGKFGSSGPGSGSGQLTVGNFPFASQTSVGASGFYITEWYQGTIGGSFGCLRFEGSPTACTILAFNLNGSGDARMTASGIAAGGLNVTFCGTYQI